MAWGEAMHGVGPSRPRLVTHLSRPYVHLPPLGANLHNTPDYDIPDLADVAASRGG